MKTKYLIVGGLVVATAVGFGIAASKTNGGKGSVPSRPGADVKVTIIPHRDGGWVGIVSIDGVEQEATVGPMPTVDELEPQIAAFVASLDSPIFYMISSEGGTYYFDGWQNGEKVNAHQGPFTTAALATAAGSEWAKRAAVPIPA